MFRSNENSYKLRWCDKVSLDNFTTRFFVKFHPAIFKTGRKIFQKTMQKKNCEITLLFKDVQSLNAGTRLVKFMLERRQTNSQKNKICVRKRLQ